jgi:hypothetical protein
MGDPQAQPQVLQPDWHRKANDIVDEGTTDPWRNELVTFSLSLQTPRSFFAISAFSGFA